MLHPLGPAQVADVDQPVYAFFNFDESSEIGQVADPALNNRTYWEFLVQALPRVRLQLLKAQANAALAGIDVQHHGFNLVANIDQLRRMLHALRPRHFTDVHQPFDSLLQLDERTVVGDADDPPAHMRSNRITLGRIHPRIGRELLKAQRYTLLLAIELENLHLDLVAHLHQVARMRQAPPGHVGDVQQAVNAAEVNERAVVGQVLHRAGNNAVFLQMLQGLVALLRLLFFQQLLTRCHDVAALLVQLDDADFNVVALHPVQVADGAQIDLRTGEKGACAEDINRQPPLDAINNAGGYRSLVVEGLLNLVPCAQPLRLLVREVDVAFFGVAGLAHDGDLVTALHADVAFVIMQFGYWNYPL